MRSFILLLALLVPAVCHADNYGERGRIFTAPVYRMEGDGAGRQPFAVTCSSFTAATAIVVADSTSRSVLMQALSSNTGGVCISTSSAMALPCADSMPSYEISPGASLTDYTQGAWYCSSRAGNADKLKGARNTHTLDLGTQ